MRKRKLYVSELLNRNTNKNLDYTIVIDDYRYEVKVFKDKQTALQYKDKQVLEWYYNEYHGIVIFIK